LQRRQAQKQIMNDKYYIGFAKKKYSGLTAVGQDNKRLYDGIESKAYGDPQKNRG